MASKIQGLDALQAKLKRLPQETRSAIKQALAQSADELVEMQKRMAPKKTGKLRDSIVQTWGGGDGPKYAAFQKRKGRKQSPVSGDPDLSVRISAGNSGVRYAHLVEFGTKPHTIKAKRKGILGRRGSLGKDGRLGSVVAHPGADEHPFFYPAYRALRKRIKSRITRATTKAARKVAESSK